LSFAAERKNSKWVSLLLEAGADVHAKDDKGRTPLLYVFQSWVTGGNLEILEALIRAGADVNVKCSDGRTPLNLAVENFRPECASLLLAAGARVTESDVEGARKNYKLKDDAVLEELLTALLASNPVFIELCKSGTPQEIAAMIEEGANVNAKGEDGRSVLSLVIETREPEIVSLLLAAGATVNESDLELAQKAQRLQGSAVIEELKSKYAENQQKIQTEADKQRILGKWRSSNEVRTDVYTFKSGDRVDLEIIVNFMNSKAHDTYEGKYHFSDGLLHVENFTAKLNRNGSISWNSHKTQSQFQYSFGVDEDGDEYLELKRVSYTGPDGKTEGPSEKGTRYYRLKS